MKHLLDLILLVVIGYTIYLAQSTNELIGNIRARIPYEPKAPVVYVIAEVKDSAKVCKKEVRWCYWTGIELSCSTDEKKLPSDVSHLKICSQ